MSKERAKRRAEREAGGTTGESGQVTQRAEAPRAARPAPPAKRPATKRPAPPKPRSKSRAPQPWWRRLVKPRHRQRRFTRRTRAQRVTIALIVIAVLGLIWFLADDWGVRIGLSLVAVFATPALVTMALGRSHR